MNDVNIQFGTKSGFTTLTIDPAEDLNKQMLLINTVPDTPILTPTITPPAESPSEIPHVTIGGETFLISYSLADKFGNPLAYQNILVETSIGASETQSTKTNAYGLTPVFTYGPKGSAQQVTLTATVVGSSPAITNQTTVAFVNEYPSMTLFVTPNSMGSLDYMPGTTADVLVRVRDDLGNPLGGQNIDLTIGSCTRSANWTVDPSLGVSGGLSLSGVTDSNGEFRTLFIPGTMIPYSDWQESCELQAVWIDNPSYPPQSQTLAWANHMYLSIETNVTQSTVKIGEYIDVTLNVSVRGLPGQAGPLTVVMDQDATSNMGRAISGSPTTMEQDADTASKLFISKLTPEKTRMGMETFGDATDKPIPQIGRLPVGPGPTMIPLVNAEYDKLYNLKLTGSGQDYYGSLIRSEDKIILDVTNNMDTAKNVKIIVFLSDGGSILKPEEMSAIIDKSKASVLGTEKIRIFTICYTNNAQEPSGAVQLRALSSATGGETYIARNADELAAKFDELLQRIYELCKQDSYVDLSFNNIQVNETTTMSGSELYDYIPVGIDPTYPLGQVSPATTTVDTSLRTSIIWPNQSQSFKNQTAEWPNNMIFPIGALIRGETWSTTFRLKAKVDGCYNVFGPDSFIDLGLGLGGVPLPDLPICVAQNFPDIGPLTGSLDIRSLQTEGAETDPDTGLEYFSDFATFKWDTMYNSTVSSTNSATEYVAYRAVGTSVYKMFDTKSILSRDLTDPAEPLTSILDVRNLPEGDYEIRIIGSAPDAAPDQESITIRIGRLHMDTYINLT
jgi:hypothetical protein